LQILPDIENGIEFVWIPPNYTLNHDTALGCDTVAVPGFASVDTTGWPSLPVSGALFGLPYDATDISLETLEIEYLDLPGAYHLCPVPRPIWEQAPEDSPVYLGNVRDADSDAYAFESFWPAAPVALAEDGYLRDQRVLQVALYPFQYLPATGQLRVIQRLRAKLTWTAERSSAPDVAAPDAYEALYRDALANYEQARAWRQIGGMVAEASSLLQSEPMQMLEFPLLGEGIVRLTGADLATAGVPIGEVDPQALRLYRSGQEIARRIVQQNPGTLQPTDILLFHAEELDTQYTGTNVYYLTWGEGNGLEMSVEDGAPLGGDATVPVSFAESLMVKQERVYLSNNPMPPDQNRWYWGLVLANNQPGTRVFAGTVPKPATTEGAATLRVYLTGYITSKPQHSARVLLNGHLIGEAYWPPGRNYIFDVIIPHTYLLDGENALSITAGLGVTSGQYDYIYIHRFELDYFRRYVAQDDQLFFSVDEPGDWLVQVEGWSGSAVPDLYNITDPQHPVRITGATFEPGDDGYTLSFGQSITQTERYLALTPERYLSPTAMELVTPSDWSNPANGADYIVITHGDFYTATQPLADHRRAQGLRVVVVDVEEIYNEFNYGIVDAEAIRDFVSYAYHNWTPPAPAYVLLVGDGNYDPKNNLGRGEVSYIPPYLADVDPWLGETAADNRYVAVHGNDIFPDLFLGRLPVKTAAETTAMVNKIIAYEALGPEDWQRQITFLADNADAAGNFAALSETIASQFTPAPYLPERIYHLVTHANTTATRNALLSAINQGRLIINWKGHSAVSSWASEQFMTLALVNGLNNGYRQPLMVPMTCLEGYYITPSQAGSTDRSSISESLVRLVERGAIASFAPTGLGIATGHEFLNKGLYEALFYNGVPELGPATTLAKLKLYSGTTGYRELIDTYLLMGDPAMRLNVLETDVAIEKATSPTGHLHPGAAITYTLAYTNAGPATAHNVVISDTLPAPVMNPTVTWSGAAITQRPGSRYVWDVADLPAGAGGLITITAAISNTFTGIINNVAVISTTGVESKAGNNRSETSTSVQPPTGAETADLRLAKEGPTWALQGQRVMYTLTYSNAGGATAERPRITDSLPAQLAEITVLAPGALLTTTVDQSYTWWLPDLAPGDGGIITVTATVDPSYLGPLANRASITSETLDAGQLPKETGTTVQVLRPHWLPIAMHRPWRWNVSPGVPLRPRGEDAPRYY